MNKKLIPIIATSLILASCFGNTTKGGDNDSIQNDEEVAPEEVVENQDKPLFKLVEETEYEGSENSDGEFEFEETCHYIKEYNEKGLITSMDEVTCMTEETYQYNDKDQLVSMTSYRGGYSIDFSYEYDDAGNLLKEMNGESGKVANDYEYNEKNQCVASNSYEQYEGGVLLAEEYTYNEKGQKETLVCNFVQLGETEITYYEYNKKGDVVKETKERNGELDSVSTIDYEYDQYGNWTTKLETCKYDAGNVYKYKTVREIEYW